MLLGPDESVKLLGIARSAIDAQLSDKVPPAITVDEESLNLVAGCFVTIHMNNQLRGCIGNFVSEQPLHREVAQMAVAAATGDPRFYAMSPEDIGHYKLDISILSPLEKIDDVGQIEVGTHGIYLEKDYCRGVLLPQVATEYGWNRQTFLEQTCVKAGLKTDAWQSPQTDIYIFSAQVISDEPELKD